MGKKPSDLQTGLKVSGTEITGTLNYVTGYTGFNGSVVEEQEGNYLALKFDITPAVSETTVEIIGGKKGPVTLDEDKMFVGRITNKDTQSIKVTATSKDKTATKTYKLTGLTLASKPMAAFKKRTK